MLNANDGRGGRATQTIAVDVQNVTIDPVDGNNVINNAQAHAAGGVPVSGTVTGLAAGATFVLAVADGAFAKTYTATVGLNGVWTATIPSADAVQLPNGTATVTAERSAFVTASEQVTVAETLPTLTLGKIDGNNIIDNDGEDRGGDHGDDRRDDGPAAIALSGTVTGIAPNSTFKLMVTDGSFASSYLATVNAAGTGWTATVPAADVARLPNGTATFAAQVTDVFGNTSLPAVQLVTVEGTTPIVLGVAALPAGGELDAGKTVSITLTMNEAVTVIGQPRLDLNDGGSARFDQAHSTATALVFDYTVADGQNTSDLKITGTDVAGDDAIRSLGGDDANLSGALANLGLVIDTRSPTVVGVTALPASGEVTTGQTALLSLMMSEAVTVIGTPLLDLNDGGTAAYDRARSSATDLVFDYMVAAGQRTSALRITGTELPAQSAIIDLAGNHADLEGAEAELELGVNTKPAGPSDLAHALVLPSNDTAPALWSSTGDDNGTRSNTAAALFAAPPQLPQLR
jgi:hypothetical protein